MVGPVQACHHGPGLATGASCNDGAHGMNPATVLYRVNGLERSHVQLTPEGHGLYAGKDSVRFAKPARGKGGFKNLAGLRAGDLVRLRVERVEETKPKLA